MTPRGTWQPERGVMCPPVSPTAWRPRCAPTRCTAILLSQMERPPTTPAATTDMCSRGARHGRKRDASLTSPITTHFRSPHLHCPSSRCPPITLRSHVLSGEETNTQQHRNASHKDTHAAAHPLGITHTHTQRGTAPFHHQHHQQAALTHAGACALNRIRRRYAPPVTLRSPSSRRLTGTRATCVPAART
jgi:hypothetical protein